MKLLASRPCAVWAAFLFIIAVALCYLVGFRSYSLDLRQGPPTQWFAVANGVGTIGRPLDGLGRMRVTVLLKGDREYVEPKASRMYLNYSSRGATEFLLQSEPVSEEEAIAILRRHAEQWDADLPRLDQWRRGVSKGNTSNYAAVLSRSKDGSPDVYIEVWPIFGGGRSYVQLVVYWPSAPLVGSGVRSGNP